MVTFHLARPNLPTTEYTDPTTILSNCAWSKTHMWVTFVWTLGGQEKGFRSVCAHDYPPINPSHCPLPWPTDFPYFLENLLIVFKNAHICILCTEPARQITLHFQDSVHKNRPSRNKNRQKSAKTNRLRDSALAQNFPLSCQFSKQKSADDGKDITAGPFFGRLWPSCRNCAEE